MKTHCLSNYLNNLKIIYLSIAQFSIILFAGYIFDVNFKLLDSFDTLVQLFPLYEYKNHGLKILYYLHSQPPLLNTLAILIYKISGDSYFEYVLDTLMLCVLFLNIFLINLILKTVKADINLSWFFILFPSFGLFHTWYYEPIFSLFFTNLVLYSLVLTPSSKSYLLFVIGLTSLSLVHGIFQPTITIFFIFFAFFFIFKNSINLKIIIISIIILLIPFGFSLKNYYLAKSFATSSWGGCNLSQKWPNITSGFLHTPQSIPNLPSPLGANEFNNGKINYNNLNFADTCRATLKTIIIQALHNENNKLQLYFSNVFSGFIKAESKLSLEASLNCCSLGGDRWGELKNLPNLLIKYNFIYGNFLIFIVFVPLLILFKPPLNINKYSFILFIFIFYYSLLASHFLNGEEQERMAYKNSFFLYLCFIYFLCLLISYLKRLLSKLKIY